MRSALLVAALACAHSARADTPAPYALPMQLRPVTVADAVRSDMSIAHFDTMGTGGTTVVEVLTATRKITSTLAPLFRVAPIYDSPPAGPSALAISNPLLGLVWAPKVRAPIKLALMGSVTIPVGSGGGDTPNAARATAVKDAVLARSAMDNSLFAVNDVAVVVGAGGAWVKDGVTVQAEVTIFQLTRVRGSAVEKDAHRTNSTAGLFVGWTALPALAIGGELRYQRWLSTPSAVAADPTGASRDNLSAAIGVRTKLELAGGHVLRPGLSYARGLDDPMRAHSYQIVQIDLPFVF